MKKILTLIMIAGFTTAAFAQYRTTDNIDRNNNGSNGKNRQYGKGQNSSYQKSALVVNAASQNGFSVSIDNGNTINSNSNTVRLRTLTPGTHTIIVSEYTSSILGRQVPRVIYNSAINFRAGIETTLNIDNNGQVNITERQLSGNGNSGNNGKVKKNKKNKYPHDNRNHDKEKKHGNNNGDRQDD